VSDAVLRHEQRCFIRAAAGGLISEDWCSARYVDTLASLPLDLAADGIQRPELVLYRDDRLSVLLTPFDECNPAARVALVGLTPGRHQLHSALTTAAAALRDGHDIDEAVLHAKAEGAFAGQMRVNLIRMLDDIGVHHALELPSCSALFDDRRDLATSTSAICHAVVLRDGTTYGGGTPKVDRHPLLAAFARQVLAANLAMAPEALVVPLGDAAAAAVALADIDPERVLRGFPSPAPGNGHRVRKYAAARESLIHQVQMWAP
jgi:hypothetical protein